jgi:hypothetical protein
MANIFENVESIAELEQAYIEMLKRLQTDANFRQEMAEEQIEHDYRERKQQLLGNQNITFLTTTEAKTSAGLNMHTAGEGRTYTYVFNRGANPELPAIIPAIRNNVTAVPSNLIRHAIETEGLRIKDYVPYVADGYLYIIDIYKRQQLFEIANIMEIAIEDGIDVRLRKPYKTKNFFVDTAYGTVITTILLNENDRVEYGIKSLFGVIDDEIQQLEFYA